MLEFKDYINDLSKLILSTLAAGSAFWLTEHLTGQDPSLTFAFIIGIAAGAPSLYDIYKLWHLNRTITILILEDIPEEREEIKNYLEKYFKVFATDSAEAALREARKNKNVKFAIIDEVLLENDQQSRQAYQGFDVIKRLGKDRPDMKFIILTGEIIKKAEANNDSISTLAERIDKYLAHGNVVDVIHKQLYQYKGNQVNYRGSLYNRIIDNIKLLIKAGDL